jgi:hypothetical protein
MKKALPLAAFLEGATGLALLIVPSLVAQLLLGGQLAGVGIPVARVAGIALIGLGIACWPGPPLAGMLTYSAMVTLYLAYLGLAGGFGGVLLLAGRHRARSLDGALGSGGTFLDDGNRLSVSIPLSSNPDLRIARGTGSHRHFRLVKVLAWAQSQSRQDILWRMSGDRRALHPRPDAGRGG